MDDATAKAMHSLSADFTSPDTCDHCDGRGWWASGCAGETYCFQCHGTGVMRAQGNCETCIGWGWTIDGIACATCNETGWVDEPVALYRCTTCMRTEPAPETEPCCPRDRRHTVKRVSAQRPA